MCAHRMLRDTSGWDSSTPSVCDTCLGPSPFVRIIEQEYATECKVCTVSSEVEPWHSSPATRPLADASSSPFPSPPPLSGR